MQIQIADLLHRSGGQFESRLEDTLASRVTCAISVVGSMRIWGLHSRYHTDLFRTHTHVVCSGAPSVQGEDEFYMASSRLEEISRKLSRLELADMQDLAKPR